MRSDVYLVDTSVWLEVLPPGRGLRSLEYRDNGKVNKDWNLWTSGISISAQFLPAAVSASREPYRQSGKRKPEIVAKPPEQRHGTLDTAEYPRPIARLSDRESSWREPMR